jgi:oligosaccharide reducing-end xylanase
MAQQCLVAQQKHDYTVEEGAFKTKNYRNLFKENGHGEKQVNDKLDAAFRQLFYGDSATQAIYFKAGENVNGPLSYILDVLNNDIRSEGMSYGMMITLQQDKKAAFDAIWNYAISKMYISKPGHPAEGYFAWSLKRSGVPNSEGPAPDGEEYFVTALYMASGRWGNGQGIYNYKYWADRILTNMRHHPLLTGPTTFGNQTIGSMVNEERKMILFVPQSNRPGFSDPSYHLPAFYEYWAKCGPKEDRGFWAAAADSSRSYFQKAAHPVTALTPDYADFDGKPVTTPFNKNSKNFAYDSWRSAMNWSVDWSWWSKDPREKMLSNRIQDFFYTQGIKSYGGVYTPDGQLIERNHPAGLVATNATASLAATHNKAKEFVEELWNLPVPQNIGDRYYGGLLYMMSFLHCSGQFRIYMPQE